VQVVTPTKLNHREQNLIKELAKSQRNMAPHLAQFQQGLFAKLRDRFLNV
jgi:molecular chaperone DnaJ